MVQRFRNDLGLFVHLHALVTDGCFDASDPDEPCFRPLEGLADEHLVHTLQRVHADIAAEPDHGDDGDREPPPDSPLLVTAFGMQLHAAVTVDGRDRSRLERLCRYLCIRSANRVVT